MVEKLKIPAVVGAALLAGFFLAKVWGGASGGAAVLTSGTPVAQSPPPPLGTAGLPSAAPTQTSTDLAPAVTPPPPAPSPTPPPTPEPTATPAASPLDQRGKAGRTGGNDPLDEEADEPDAKPAANRKGKERANLDEYGFERADTSQGDFVEMQHRLAALEQAFSTDAKRNKSRGAGGAVTSSELGEIRESVRNLYQIVEALPSIDTLNVKIAAVDGAIEEMNGTIEKINSVAQKLDGADISAALKASGEAVKAANDSLGETRKIKEELAKAEEKLAALAAQEQGKGEAMSKELVSQLEAEKTKREEMAVRLETEKSRGDELASRLDELTLKVEGQGTQLAEKTSLVKRLREELDAAKTSLGAVEKGLASDGKNIAILDKNMRIISSSYQKVYDNALKVDGRLISLEAFVGDATSRLQALERNISPQTE